MTNSRVVEIAQRQTLAILLLLAVFSPTSNHASAQRQPQVTDSSSQIDETGPVRLVWNATKSQAKIIEPIQIGFFLEAPRGSTVVWPQFGERIGGLDLETVDTLAGIPVDDAPGIRTWTIQLTVQALRTGVYSVPPLEFVVSVPDGEDNGTRQHRVGSKEIPIEIVSVLNSGEGPTNFRDIKDVIDRTEIRPPTSPRILWPWAIVLAILAAAAGVGWRYWKRDRSLSSTAWAMQQIAGIRSAQADVAPARTVEHANRILGSFLRLHFGITTNATQQMKDSLPPDAYAAWVEFSKLSDNVLYAGLPVTSQQACESLGQLESIIFSCTSNTP